MDLWTVPYLPYEDEEPRRSGVSPTVRYDLAYEDTIRVFARAASMPEPHVTHGREAWYELWVQGGPELGWKPPAREQMPYDVLMDLYEMTNGKGM